MRTGPAGAGPPAAMRRAMAAMARAEAASGSLLKIGVPLSLPSRSAGSSGTSPSSGDAEISRQRGAAALAEGVRRLAAARAGETGHVLDHADQRLAELLDHLRRSRGDALGGWLAAS